VDLPGTVCKDPIGDMVPILPPEKATWEEAVKGMWDRLLEQPALYRHLGNGGSSKADQYKQVYLNGTV
jgi:hypothetical protein